MCLVTFLTFYCRGRDSSVVFVCDSIYIKLGMVVAWLYSLFFLFFTFQLCKQIIIYVYCTKNSLN